MFLFYVYICLGGFRFCVTGYWCCGTLFICFSKCLTWVFWFVRFLLGVNVGVGYVWVCFLLVGLLSWLDVLFSYLWVILMVY